MFEINKNLVDENGLTEEEFLNQYKKDKNPTSLVAVDTILLTFKDGCIKILFRKRNKHPYISNYALPGSFIKNDSNLETSAFMQIQPFVKYFIDTNFSQLHMFSNIDRDPRARVISCAFLAITNCENLNDIENEQYSWFDIKVENNRILFLNDMDKIVYDVVDANISFNNQESTNILAFDHIDEILMAVNNIRKNMFDSDISHSFLTDNFSPTDLKKVYEEFLGRELNDKDFTGE